MPCKRTFEAQNALCREEINPAFFNRKIPKDSAVHGGFDLYFASKARRSAENA
jgi:hypothetical protein